MKTLSSLLVVAAACGTDRAGGGGSETHWMDPCEVDADCAGAEVCACGVCTLECAEFSDCVGLGGSAKCANADGVPSCDAAPVAIGVCLAACDSRSECRDGFDCVAGSCSPVVAPEPMPEEAGAGGASGGRGGSASGGRQETGGAKATGGALGEAGAGGTLSCEPGTPGIAGAVSLNEAPPPAGKYCQPYLEGFELCSQVYDSLEPTHTVLSKCVDFAWTVLEDPSTCEPIGGPLRRECNYPNAFTGMCCDAPKYCPQYDMLCDGVWWYR